MEAKEPAVKTWDVTCENFQVDAQLELQWGGAHLVKSPLNAHEDLNSDPQQPCKRQEQWHTSVTSVLGMQISTVLELIGHPV